MKYPHHFRMKGKQHCARGSMVYYNLYGKEFSSKLALDCRSENCGMFWRSFPLWVVIPLGLLTQTYPSWFVVLRYWNSKTTFRLGDAGGGNWWWKGSSQNYFELVRINKLELSRALVCRKELRNNNEHHFANIIIFILHEFQTFRNNK